MSTAAIVTKAKAFVCLTSFSLLEITLVTTSALLLLLPFPPAAKATSGLRVPTFLQEPPSRLLFGNDTGSQASCTAHGNPPPIVSWVLSDGTMATQVPGLRKIAGNGTLYFPPFLAQYYRSDVHETMYRCRATNEVGTILSRNVHVQA
ncbi:cell adhesion molecule Dscam2-like, partial [Musca vetustissima]|uniref:cell adhesion molecule Dscam2-like n=1 Tax=Musca vetustissima TaxID=27455 RepID=UPI002AB7BDB5